MRQGRGQKQSIALRFAAAALALITYALAATAQTTIQRSTPGSSAHAKGSAISTTSPPSAEAAPAPAALPARILTLSSRREGAVTRLTVGLEGAGRLRVYRLEGPDRLVIEGTGLGFGPGLATASLAPGTAASDFRYGSLAAGEGRLVVDLAERVRLLSATVADDILSVAVSADGLRAPPEEPVIVVFGPDALPPPPASLPPTAWAATTAAAGADSAAPRARKVIVIDPGHGGRDPGAVTESGLYEKDVVLAVGRRLSAVLAKRAGYDVRMTRDADQSLSLDRRVELSRAARADLFISLHADTFAGQPQAASVHGGAVYVLAEQASDRFAETLARRENAADMRLGLDASGPARDPSVDAILSDLTQRETRAFAARAQASLVRSLPHAMTLAREPARGAAFRVLKQAETPAVLIELGYMSNRDDVARLTAPDWQGRVAEAIARAVDTYFADPRSILGAN